MDDAGPHTLLMNPWTWIVYGLVAVYLIAVARGTFSWRREVRRNGKQDEKK